MEKRFIKATEDYCSFEKQVAAPYLRRAFNIDGRAEDARISICGLGFYVLFINGVNVTKGHIAPYISNPDHLCYYDEYDVTEYLREGENVIGVMLGNGFINNFGGYEWNFDKAVFRGTPRLALEFKCSTAGGELAFCADEKFLCHPSPLLSDDLRAGEIYDARLELPGWNMPGYDTSDWTPALHADATRGKMRRCTAEPIRDIKLLEPVKIIHEDDAYVYDFGVNTAGVCTLRIKGNAGQTVVMRHGEMLVDGRFYAENLKFHKRVEYDDFTQTDVFICSGRDDEFTSFFSYKGFRYVKVEGITEEQATRSLLTYHVKSSDLNVIGGFHCSDERINTLYRMVDNANRSNFYYFPTDCPHREKNGWTGDASLSADNMTLMYDTESSYREWLYSIRCAQDERGALPGIVPTAGWGFLWGNGPTWDSVLFNLPYMLYKFRGCTEVIKENAHAMVRYLDYIMTRRSENGTVAIGLGDWVPVNKSADKYDAPLALTDSVMVMDMARKASEMFVAVGDSHRAGFAEGIYRDMRDTVRRELVNLNTMEVAGSCQSSQAIAIYYGVFERHEIDMAYGHLKRFIDSKDGAFDCGFIGMHCIFHVLSEMGDSELAFSMITRDSFPSYTLLIEEGHTALPEHFLNNGSIPSMNHHFLGDVSRWFTTRLAGLNVKDTRTVEISPADIKSIDFASAYYDLPAGRVSVSWHRNESGEMEVEYSAPEGVNVYRV